MNAAVRSENCEEAFRLLFLKGVPVSVVLEKWSDAAVTDAIKMADEGDFSALRSQVCQRLVDLGFLSIVTGANALEE